MVVAVWWESAYVNAGEFKTKRYYVFESWVVV